MKRLEGDDTSERWRASYTRVRKDLLSDSETTNRKRLTLLGVDRLPRDTALLDVGAGDGNLYRTLRAQGFVNVYSFEYQPQLAGLHPDRERVVVASATNIPFSTASMSAVIVMDVLHHLTPAQLPLCLQEVRRVLKKDGKLYICEPACTFTRQILSLALMSPLSRFAQFSRDKRAMVEQEWSTLQPWLEHERSMPGTIMSAGFSVELFRRLWLHHYGRFHPGTDDDNSFREKELNSEISPPETA